VAAPDVLAEGLKSKVLGAAGNPAQYGAQHPDENIFAAGIAQSQHFLASVAEGRIVTRPWIKRIDESTVHFADGSSCVADALLFGTGYRLSLPWLAPSIARVLGLDDRHIDLHEHTWHPQLPGLAFVGLQDQIGPIMPVLELQARWVAYTFAGLIPAPAQGAMIEGLARCQARRDGPQTVTMNAMALLFARNAGVEPTPSAWPDLERALLFGPLSPISFRLQGPDRLDDAPGRTAAAAAAFGAISSPEFNAEEQQLRARIRTCDLEAA
jgi:dimethylaniline monooxygenase (N-oxide forming)